jgi:hypothetical protein
MSGGQCIQATKFLQAKKFRLSQKWSGAPQGLTTLPRKPFGSQARAVLTACRRRFAAAFVNPPAEPEVAAGQGISRTVVRKVMSRMLVDCLVMAHAIVAIPRAGNQFRDSMTVSAIRDVQTVAAAFRRTRNMT